MQDGPIHVSYGYSKVSGFFLTANDPRLEFKENANENVNSVALQVRCNDKVGGAGNYVDLHTKIGNGSGIKVTNEVIAEYMFRYGVEPMFADKARKNQVPEVQ